MGNDWEINFKLNLQVVLPEQGSASNGSEVGEDTKVGHVLRPGLDVQRALWIEKESTPDHNQSSSLQLNKASFKGPQRYGQH